MQATSGRLVLFRLAGQAFALDAAQVRECLPLPRLWQRPGQPSHVAGFFSLGPAVVPVLDLARLLGLREPDAAPALEADGLYRHLLRLDEAALLVDRITGVGESGPPNRPAATGSPAESWQESWQQGCVVARPTIDGEPVALLDADRLLRRDERDRLTLLAAQEAARRDGWQATAAVTHAG